MLPYASVAADKFPVTWRVPVETTSDSFSVFPTNACS
jgi:hypothetical protein